MLPFPKRRISYCCAKMGSEGAATALATIGTVCWCVQLIPQIIYNYRRKDCTGLPPTMMFLWVVSGVPFGVYFLVTKANIILQIQPHLFMFFCSISWIQSLYYPPRNIPIKRIMIWYVVPMSMFIVGFEIGFTLWLRPVYSHGTKWPALLIGIFAAILLAAGLVPPYFELWKRRGRVVGINFLFLFVDSMGAWFNIASVIVGNMDVMGIVLYSVVAAMEIGIFASHFIWCCRFKWFGNSLDEEDLNSISDLDSASGDVDLEIQTITDNNNTSIHSINSNKKATGA